MSMLSDARKIQEEKITENIEKELRADEIH